MNRTQPNQSTRPVKPYWILLSLSFGIFIAADDLTVVSTLLPQIIVDLEIPVPSGLDDAAWIVTAYLIANIVSMPLVGKFSDIFGRMEVYIGSMVLFLLGSIAVPLVEDLNWLIVFRVVQAVGSGAMIPVSMALIGDVFSVQRRGVAMGVLGAIDTLGWIFGPLYGAFLVRHLNWRWQFYLNIPASVIAIVTAYMVLKDIQFPRAKERLDITGGVLFTLALTALNLGLSYIGGRAAAGVSLQGEISVNTLQKVTICLILAAVLFVIFILLERRVNNPLIDLSIFRYPNFFVACLANFLMGFALITAMVNVPLFINTILTRGANMDEIIRNAASDSGSLLAVMTASMAVLSFVGGLMTRAWGYRFPTLIGLGLGALGFYQMGQWAPDVNHATMRLNLALVGIGFGMIMAPLNTAVVNSVDEFKRGIASSLAMLFRMVGMSVGLSWITAWSLRRFYILSQDISIGRLGSALPDINAQIYNETFLFGGLALLIGLIPGFLIRDKAAANQEVAIRNLPE